MNIEWKQYRIGEVADVTSSKRIFLSDYVLEGIPFYRSKEVIEKFNGNDISLELFIKSEQYENIKRKFGVPQKDDILLTSVGTIGVPYKVKQNEVFYFKDGNLTWIRKYKKEIDPSFLFQWIRSEIGQKTIQQNLIGSSQSALTIADIKKLKIQLPPYAIQQRIASILSAYDDLIEVNNQRIKLLEETARELYKEWFVRMRFPGYKKAKFVKGVPEGWEVKELKDFGKIHTGKTPPTKVREYYGGEIPFIKTPDLHKNQFIFETEEFLTDKGNNTQKRSCLPKGSICVSCIGTGGVVGLTTAEKSQTNQQINSLIPANNMYTEFLYYAMCDLKETIELFGGTGATMTNLSKGKFEKLKILFANNDLVDKYNSLVSPMFEQIQILQQQNTQLRQIRDRLLPRLISGKLEVKEQKALKKTQSAK